MIDMSDELKVQILLKGLEDTEIEKVASRIVPVSVRKDDYVFKKDDSPKGIFMIKSGSIEISKTTPDSWKQPLVILKRGSFMGEIATLEQTNHATDARAMEPAELFLLPKEVFEKMEKNDPFIMLKIIKNIAIIAGLNIRRMNEKFIKVLVNY